MIGRQLVKARERKFCCRQLPKNSNKNFVYDELCQLSGTDQELGTPASEKKNVSQSNSISLNTLEDICHRVVAEEPLCL